jgi:hypothetical protein
MTGIYEQFMNTHGSQTFHIYFFPIGKSLGERGKGVPTLAPISIAVKGDIPRFFNTLTLSCQNCDLII